MSASFGRNLILEKDGLRTQPFVSVDRMHDSLHIAIAVVAVHKHRQIACCHDVANTGFDFAQSQQPDVWNAIAGTNERESSK